MIELVDFLLLCACEQLTSNVLPAMHIVVANPFVKDGLNHTGNCTTTRGYPCQACGIDSAEENHAHSPLGSWP